MYPNRVDTGDNPAGHTAAFPPNDVPQLHGEPVQFHTTATDCNPAGTVVVVGVVDVVGGVVVVVGGAVVVVGGVVVVVVGSGCGLTVKV